jgi:hypothetical protein
MAGGTRAIFFGQHLPLATSPQYKQNAIQHSPERDSWMSLGITWLFLGQNVLYFIPDIVWDAFDSRKMFLFLYWYFTVD